MTVVINMHKPYFIFMSCHGYEDVMLVLCTPLQSDSEDWCNDAENS